MKSEAGEKRVDSIPWLCIEWVRPEESLRGGVCLVKMLPPHIPIHGTHRQSIHVTPKDPTDSTNTSAVDQLTLQMNGGRGHFRYFGGERNGRKKNEIILA